MNGPRSRAIGVSRGKFIFSFMKTLGFQTFLFYPRSRASGYLSELKPAFGTFKSKTWTSKSL